MKSIKIIGLLLSLVLMLGVALTGTLATSTDTTGSGSEFSISTGTMEKTEQDSATPLEDAENNDIAFTEDESLYARLMACETLDELFAIVDAASEDELMALTDEENAEIEAKITDLESAPLPPVILEDCENESVISEIIYPAVNFDHVAPFGAPVEG